MLLFTEAYETDTSCYYRRAHLRRLEKARAYYPRRNARRQQLREERQARAAEVCAEAARMGPRMSAYYQDALDDARMVGVIIR